MSFDNLQRWAKKWSLGCVNFLPGPAWLLLSQTAPLFSPSMYSFSLTTGRLKNSFSVIIVFTYANQIGLNTPIWLSAERGIHTNTHGIVYLREEREMRTRDEERDHPYWKVETRQMRASHFSDDKLSSLKTESER